MTGEELSFALSLKKLQTLLWKEKQGPEEVKES